MSSLKIPNAAGSFHVQYSLNYNDEIIVDYFCGGGGASTGLEKGLKRSVFSSVNHNPKAVSMHMANHPCAKHFVQDVFAACLKQVTEGKRVGWFHASPDCTHHSQAAGGQPRKKEIRDLSWVILKVGGQLLPRIISLENVKQILNWCPLIAKRCKVTGRVIKLDRTVAEPGERVPRHEQFLVPDPKRKGQTWKQFVHSLESLGYKVEWRVLKACDFGAPTTRERLFMIARRDGEAIKWPEPTHFKNPKRGQLKWRSAAECIDFNDLGKSIFGRKKDLADASLRRIAKGFHKFVKDCDDPYFVEVPQLAAPFIGRDFTGGNVGSSITDPLPTTTALFNGHSQLITPILAPYLTEFANSSHQRNMPIDQPLTTICAKVKGGHHGLVTPYMVHAGHGEGSKANPRWSAGCNSVEDPLGTVTSSGGGGRAMAAPILVKFRHNSEGADLRQPLPTITSGGNSVRPAGAAHAMGVASAFLMQANGGFNTTIGRGLDEPMTTVTNTGSQQQLVSCVFTQAYYGSKSECDDRSASMNDPLRTIPTENRHSLISATLSKENLEGALRVASFLINYYGNGDARDLREPLDTVTTKDRLALVTIWYKGEPWVIVDIKIRMLHPRELFRAQGFPDSYIIDRGHDGKPMSKSDQVFMCGNSVSPPPMEAIARANDPWFEWREAA